MSNLKELARLAGVDVSTVSRALNDSPRVRDSTKQLIKKLALELNYMPDELARGLVGKKTFTIGIVIPELKNTFYAEIIEGLESELSLRGFTLLFGKSDFNKDKESKCIEMFIRRRVDGIIVCANRLKTFNASGKNVMPPIVFVDSFYDKNEFDSISIDNNFGIDAVINHLSGLGHTKIGFIGDTTVTEERLNSYKEKIKQYDLEENNNFIAIGKERYEYGGYLRMKELLSLTDRPTAVFAVTDNLAIGAIKAAMEMGCTVPGDISIVGFDDINVSSYLDIPLTTVVQQKTEIGRTAANLLLKRINEGYEIPVQKIVLKPQLVVRSSTSRKR